MTVLEASWIYLSISYRYSLHWATPDASEGQSTFVRGTEERHAPFLGVIGFDQQHAGMYQAKVYQSQT